VLFFSDLPIGQRLEGMSCPAVLPAHCTTILGPDSTAVTAVFDGFSSGVLLRLNARALTRLNSTGSRVGRLCGASTVSTASTVLSRFLCAELRSHGIRISAMAALELQWTPGRNPSDRYVGWHTVHTARTDLSGIHIASVLLMLFVLMFPDFSIRVRLEGASWHAIFAARCIAIPGPDSATVTTVFDGFFSGLLPRLQAQFGAGCELAVWLVGGCAVRAVIQPRNSAGAWVEGCLISTADMQPGYGRDVVPMECRGMR